MTSDPKQMPGFVSNANSPRQNRVTPFGEIISIGDRGNMMGNRGCLHSDNGRILRLQQRKAWIICRIAFGDRHRTIMAPNLYTELFFWDEATALAAGHRPCYECSREKYIAFVDAWRRGNPTDSVESSWKVAQLDNALAADRLTAGSTKHTYVEQIDALPQGTFIAWLVDNRRYPVLIYDNELLLWTPGGYRSSCLKPKNIDVEVLTPKSTVNAINAGYVPSIELPRMTLLPVEHFDLFDYTPSQSRYKRKEEDINEQFLRPIK